MTASLVRTSELFFSSLLREMDSGVVGVVVRTAEEWIYQSFQFLYFLAEYIGVGMCTEGAS